MIFQNSESEQIKHLKNKTIKENYTLLHGFDIS